MKFQAILENKSSYPVWWLCQVLSVSRSGYYHWFAHRHQRERRQAEDARLVNKIKALHYASSELYGSPKIYDRLQDSEQISQSTVARMMRKHGIRSKVKRKFKVTTNSNHNLPVAPNHLMQDFRAYAPDQIWMSDITYVWTDDGWLYVCAVIDLFAKKIVGWAASHRMTTELVVQAYMRARAVRQPGKWLIFHSDQGSQYASREFAGLLRKHGVIQSMSRRGNCWDAAPIESLWARLKVECVYWYRFHTRSAAVNIICQWIHNYNNERTHSANKYLSPVKKEIEFRLAKMG